MGVTRGQAASPTAPTASEFEQLAHRLKLTPDQYEGSQGLRAWAQKHKTWRYVPEDLLQAWGMIARPFLSPKGATNTITAAQRFERSRRAGLASAEARRRREKEARRVPKTPLRSHM